MPYIIKDPLIELLAIKLYEHDPTGEVLGNEWPHPVNCWLAIPDEDRELYRQMARGEESI